MSSIRHLFQEALDWSEVWSLLIPIITLLVVKPRARWVTPVKYYVFIALLINFVATIIWKQSRIGLYDWMYERFPFLYNADGTFSNTLLYNIHSILRFFLFAWFFHETGRLFRKINMLIPVFFLLMILIVFVFFKDIRDFSSLLLGTESALLLVYCLIYYLNLLRDEKVTIKQSPSFWTVTGLSIYVVVNFPIFLFYTVLARQSVNFAVDIWDVHNLSYIVFNLFIAKSFYAAGKQS